MRTTHIAWVMIGLAWLGITRSAWSQANQTQGQSPFETWDRDKDGYVSRAEFPRRFGRALFDRIDADGDGRISRKEDDDFRARRARANRTQRRPNVPAGTVIQRNVIYSKAGDRQLPLDLYRPGNAQGPTPLVLWVHGGGWRNGSKNNPGPAIGLVSRGYAVASVEYRLSGEAIFPAAIEDCKAAVSFLRLNAKKYQLDPKRFGAWGSSAGGHLVALLGTTSDSDEFRTQAVARQASPAVQAVCNWFGPTDFLRMNDFPGRIDHDAADSPESRFIGGAIQENRKKVRRANPITYVTAGDPPMLLMHGDADALVPIDQSERLHKALQNAKVPSELIRVAKGGHGFGGAAESRAELTEVSMKFFDRVFGMKAKEDFDRRPANETRSSAIPAGTR